ncbi:pyruvate:ferredoxin (flavodoxin) oxidoreductase [Dictyobacter kobayashii]|uniref:Pyruvate-flavodoxin oxidoreductase n=1 Tax=Dictyobacter kobayashii TaxID=2014872 RepID=A0A402AMY7_9CHLR|nr:pyruvate:ferredoxin (flavodoxin) oxidoreductase [Dictyobacter kobayashii]GCE20558.1 pyruvate-flavodoxin oxidoreductase [Dictyobacter kobayashii]
MEHIKAMLDGNEAAAAVAYAVSDVVAIYPITPSTPMGESVDAWSAHGKANLWGSVPLVVEMQSEGGVAGALHGALQTGALASTFTASQGLLLMIPNMYKIAGELTAAVFHVAARSLAAQGLSIFGDHSDVMAVRGTGFALLASNSVQEAQDLALIAHAATLKARIPFVHFFDGFRTSHEIAKITLLEQGVIRAMIDDTLVNAHRARALSPDHPVIRGTAQNPDVYFQARETVNPFYQRCPEIVQQTMDDFAALTGRDYHLFDYVGAPDAERVIVMMGSGAETAEQTAKYLVKRGEKVGVLKVHLFRPFALEHFVRALPASVKTLAVLDRTKDPGSAGEPLYVDIVTALNEARQQGLFPNSPYVIGGRYGLSSKEFTPAMVKGIYDHMLGEKYKNHFTIGINDDVSYTSLPYDPAFTIEGEDIVQCVFWGLGSDGTVGANKNSIKMIGEETENYAQGYFVYDSKKSGSVTISHLRFGPHAFSAPYLIDVGRANFVACHQFAQLERFDVLKYARPGAVFLLNTQYGPDDIWGHLPLEVRQVIREKQLRFYVIDAYRVAGHVGMGGRINTVMQTCFFAISNILPAEQAIAQIKQSIKKTYSKRGEVVVQQNYQAVDDTLAQLYSVSIPATDEMPMPVAVQSAVAIRSRVPVALPMLSRKAPVAAEAPVFVRDVLGPMLVGEGDNLPVSALPCDGSYPVGTARWEKRNIAQEIPAWDPAICIQCNKCVMVCPHAVIRARVYDPVELRDMPETFQTTPARFKEFPDMNYTLQVAPEDCTGCGLCVEACPVKDKSRVGHKAINMVPQPPLRESEKINWDYFLRLPEVDTTELNLGAIKNAELRQPLFEFSGACSGCGETPYIKLVSQLFGDHMIVANATGCSSIYGGNLPTTPWSANAEGRGPAWSNSLFEDNAEFGLGMRLSLDQQQAQALALLQRCAGVIGDSLVQAILHADQTHEAGLRAQRERVVLLKQLLSSRPAEDTNCQQLLVLADALVRKTVWIIGGDGWAYDIGYGGLDHVLASGRNVNILVLDTEVYSNTGGQASKATPRAAVAKFAAQGKALPKKDLGLLAMAYGHVYVAHIAMGANDQQTLHAIMEADTYDGPSLIIAYSHCIAHGIDMRKGLEQQKLAVQTGYWPLYRYNPALLEEGKNPLIMDAKEATLPLSRFMYNEARFRMLLQSDETRAASLLHLAEKDVQESQTHYYHPTDGK